MYFFVWGFQMGMFDRSRSGDCPFYIEQVETGQVNNK